jgi:DNA excision repair protein ERCC-3
MSRNSANPLIVQADRTILVEVDNPRYTDARDALARFAELEKSPEHIHTYRITPLSLWNAAAAGLGAAEAVDVLERFGKYPLPDNVRADIFDYVARYGRLKLVRDGSQLLLVSDDRALLMEVRHHPRVAPLIIGHRTDGALVIDPAQRGHVKHTLVQFGYPAEDLAGYVDGARLEVALRAAGAQDGVPFTLRDYQRDAAAVFHASGSARGGSGVIVLPCGAGKTLVGLAVMAQYR